MTYLHRTAIGSLPLVLLCVGCTSKEKTETPTQSTPPPAAVTVTSVAVTGTNTLTTKGATSQLAATATMSNGTTENRTSTATWQSDNTGVATVSAQGVVTAVASGDATISATVTGVRGTRAVNVALRTPNPAAGQRLPLPDVQAFIFQTAGARPDLLARSCPNGRKYENNPWLDYMVDNLRTLDTRWGYNGKPTRTPADNNGFPVIAAGDEIAYHFSGGSDQGSPDVYLIDILLGHCGPTPSITFRHFTGEEPGFWTGANRLPSGNGLLPTLLASDPFGR